MSPSGRRSARPWVVPGSDITWLVLAREVAATVAGMDRVVSVMVLDVDTGLVRGLGLEATTSKAMGLAFDAALSRPAAELPPGPPIRVVCATGLADQVRTALTDAEVPSETAVTEVVPGAEAEDIFDSFLGHLAGRSQPREFPEPDDWRLLIERTREFRRTEPWSRWSDEQDLLVQLQLEEGNETYVAIVMGQAGVQRGLALYPGPELPSWLRENRPPEEAPLPPPGALIITLDAWDELPTELTAKAVRYGWPEEEELVPLFIAFTEAGATEIGRDGAIRLTAALAAVLHLDKRGLALAGTDGTAVRGSIVMADQQSVGYAVEHRPPPEAAPESGLRLQRAGHDLIPIGTPVSLGHLSWEALAGLRSAAQVHRPAPANAPEPAGQEVALLVTCPDPERGPALTARIAELDPYGVSTADTPDGQTVLVLAGGGGAEVLFSLPATHPSLTAFRRRLRSGHGRHVVMVADASSSTGDGQVYGLFECHQPMSPTRPRSKRPR